MSSPSFYDIHAPNKNLFSIKANQKRNQEHSAWQRHLPTLLKDISKPTAGLLLLFHLLRSVPQNILWLALSPSSQPRHDILLLLPAIVVISESALSIILIELSAQIVSAVSYTLCNAVLFSLQRTSEPTNQNSECTDDLPGHRAKTIRQVFKENIKENTSNVPNTPLKAEGKEEITEKSILTVEKQAAQQKSRPSPAAVMRAHASALSLATAFFGEFPAAAVKAGGVGAACLASAGWKGGALLVACEALFWAAARETRRRISAAALRHAAAQRRVWRDVEEACECIGVVLSCTDGGKTWPPSLDALCGYPLLDSSSLISSQVWLDLLESFSENSGHLYTAVASLLLWLAGIRNISLFLSVALVGAAHKTFIGAMVVIVRETARTRQITRVIEDNSEDQLLGDVVDLSVYSKLVVNNVCILRDAYLPGVTCEVPLKGLVALQGPSGSGKTSFCEFLCGEVDYVGTVMLCGGRAESLRDCCEEVVNLNNHKKYESTAHLLGPAVLRGQIAYAPVNSTDTELVEALNSSHPVIILDEPHFTDEIIILIKKISEYKLIIIASHIIPVELAEDILIIPFDKL